MKKLNLPILLFFVLFVVFLLFSSCESYKKVATSDKTKINTVSTVKEVKRKADSISIVVPNVVYKDTVITKVNYETKTIARIVYDDDGNKRFDCLPAEISERLERIETNQSNNVKIDSEKERSFNPQYILYAIGFVCLVVVVGLGLLGFLVVKTQKQMPELLAGVLKEIVK